MSKIIEEIYHKTGANSGEYIKIGSSVTTEELSINISNVNSNGWQDNSANSLYFQEFNNTNYLNELKSLLKNAKQVSAFIRVDWEGTKFEMPTNLETFQPSGSSYIYPFFKWRASANAETYIGIGNIPGIGSSGVFFSYTSTNKNILFNRLDDWEMYDGIELVVRIMK